MIGKLYLFFIFYLLSFVVLGLSLEARTNFQKAKHAFSKQEWKHAYELFKKSMKNEKNAGEAIFYMAYIREKQRYKDRANELYIQALSRKLNPKIRETVYWKIVLYLKQIQDWKELLRYSTDFYNWIPKKTILKLKNLATSRLSSQNHNSYLSYREAKKSLRNKDYDEAMRQLENVLIYSPSHSQAHWNLALLKIQKKKYLASLGHLKLLLGIKKNYWPYHYKIAISYFHLKNYNKAKEHILLASQFYPNKKEKEYHNFTFYTNYMLGIIFLETEKPSQAIPYLFKAKKLRPLSEILGALSFSYYLLEKNKKAKQYIKKALNKNTKEKWAHLTLFYYAIKENNENKASSEAKILAKILEEKKIDDKKFSLIYAILAKNAFEEEEWNRVVNYFKKIKKIPKGKFWKSFDYNFAYAQALYYEEKYEKSLELLASLPKSKKQIWWRSLCYARLGQSNSTIYLLDKLDPSFKEKIKEEEAFESLGEKNIEFNNYLKSK